MPRPRRLYSFPLTSTSSDPSSLLLTLHLCVLDTTVFRIDDIPLSTSVVSSFQAPITHPLIQMQGRYGSSLGENKVRFACWASEDGTGWKETGDFTGVEAGNGGRVELTVPTSVSIEFAASKYAKNLTSFSL